MPSSRRRDRWRPASRLALPLVGLLAVGVVTLSCRPSSEQPTVDFQVPVMVTPAVIGTVEEWIETTGTLTTENSVRLFVENSGVLMVARTADGRRLEEGDHVSRGQLVATVAGEDVRLHAMTEANRHLYEERRAQFESSEQLFAGGLISREALTRAETVLAQASLELERSLRTEARGRLTTPISGIVLRLPRNGSGQSLADGQLVERGFEVAQIAPLGSLIAEIEVVGSDVGRIAAGMPARIAHPAWNGTVFAGEVRRLAPSIDERTRALRAEVAVDNGAGLLRPGMYVEVLLLADRRADVLTIPERAVVGRGGETVVFVLAGQRVERRAVAVGLTDARRVEILSGLRVGERVVVEGQETLSDGTRVQSTAS